MPFDRRLSLAVVFARGQRMDLARQEFERCVAEVDETRLRFLTGYELFHFEFLRKSFGLELSNPGLRRLIDALLSGQE